MIELVSTAEISAVSTLGLATALSLILVGFLISQVNTKLDKIIDEVKCVKLAYVTHHENAIQIKDSQKEMAAMMIDHCQQVHLNGGK